MKKMIIISLLIIFLGTAAFAENVVELDKAELSWSLDGEDLTVTMSAETKGWISVGLGSNRMDGAVMFFGFVKDDTVYFEEHLGKGHRHNKTDVQRQVEYEVTENDGVTEMDVHRSKG